MAKSFPSSRALPARDGEGITAVPRDTWLWKAPKASDEKITGFVKQHFITGSLVRGDEFGLQCYLCVINNLLFWRQGVCKSVRSLKEPMLRLGDFGSVASKVQSLWSLA